MAATQGEVCPAYDRRPRVVVAVAHHHMRALIVDLLARRQPGWAVSAVDGLAEVGAVLPRHPDVAVVDAADFAGCCGDRLGSFPVDRIVVIGPEPDPFYRQATLDQGAGGWISRDEVCEELGSVIGVVLGCSPRPCQPPTNLPRHPPPRSKEDAR